MGLVVILNTPRAVNDLWELWANGHGPVIDVDLIVSLIFDKLLRIESLNGPDAMVVDDSGGFADELVYSDILFSGPFDEEYVEDDLYWCKNIEHLIRDAYIEYAADLKPLLHDLNVFDSNGVCLLSCNKVAVEEFVTKIYQ